MFGLSTTQLVLVAGCGLLLLLVWGGAPILAGLKSMAAKATGGGTTAPVAKTPRLQAIEALDVAMSYFESVGCDEGIAAVTVAATHAFTKHLDPVALTPGAVKS